MAKSKKPGPKATIKKPTGFEWQNNGRKPGGYTLRGASASDRKAPGKQGKPNPSRTHGKSCKCDPCRRRHHRAEARDRELDGVPSGRHATATAGAAKAPPHEHSLPGVCSWCGRVVKVRQARGAVSRPVTLRDLVRAAQAEGCELDVSLEPVAVGLNHDQYEVAPGRFVQIALIPGAADVFGAHAFTDGIKVMAVYNAAGELVLKLSREYQDDVMAEVPVSRVFRIAPVLKHG